MIDHILFALWFFLPAGVANMTPVLTAKAPGLRHWNTPVDFGHSFRGHRILGDHKTWRGISTGITMGLVTTIILAIISRNYDWPSNFLGDYTYLHGGKVMMIGFLLSVGALGGDALKSFFKRQLNVQSGKSWFPFDQLDYIVGALVIVAIQIRLTLVEYVFVFVLWFAIHLITSYIGYHLKLKSEPI